MLPALIVSFWANLPDERLDVVQEKLKDSMSFESSMDLRNTPLLGSSELFPKEALEKSNRVLHNEAIRKAVFVAKPS